MINVKIIRVPGAVREVQLDNGCTVAEALSFNGTSVDEGEAIKVNGLDCDYGQTLNNGDRIIIAKGAKGA